MAVGDVVGFVYSSDTTFQPAAGVQVVITQYFVDGSNSKLEGLGDMNTSGARFQYGTGSSGSGDNSMHNWQNFKQTVFVSNTSYFRFIAGNLCGFTGIQIK